MPPSYNPDVLTQMIGAEIGRRGRGAKARLAEAADVAPQTITKWIKGETHPEPERWPMIEAHFGWDAGEITRRVVPAIGTDSTHDLVIRLTDQVLDLDRRLRAVERRRTVPSAQRRP